MLVDKKWTEWVLGENATMDITIIVTCYWSQKDVNLSVIIFHFGNLYIILILKFISKLHDFVWSLFITKYAKSRFLDKMP